MAQHNILYIRTWQKGSSKQLDLGRDQTEIKIIGNQVVQPLPIRKILSSTFTYGTATSRKCAYKHPSMHNAKIYHNFKQQHIGEEG